MTVPFNNWSIHPPAISVLWQGARLAHVLAGAGGIPALNSADGHWPDVDLRFPISGLLSVRWDGV